LISAYDFCHVTLQEHCKRRRLEFFVSAGGRVAIIHSSANLKAIIISATISLISPTGPLVILWNVLFQVALSYSSGAKISPFKLPVGQGSVDSLILKFRYGGTRRRLRSLRSSTPRQQKLIWMFGLIAYYPVGSKLI